MAFAGSRALPAWLLAALVLGGCATAFAPADCPQGGFELCGGYSELSLGGDAYRVRFEGSRLPLATVRDFAVLRAAELTLSRGHRFFIVGESEIEPKTLRIAPQTTYVAADTAACDTEGHCSTQTFAHWGGPGVTSFPISVWVLTIRTFPERPGREGWIHDALVLRETLRERYALEAEPE